MDPHVIIMYVIPALVFGSTLLPFFMPTTTLEPLFYRTQITFSDGVGTWGDGGTHHLTIPGTPNGTVTGWVPVTGFIPVYLTATLPAPQYTEPLMNPTHAVLYTAISVLTFLFIAAVLGYVVRLGLHKLLPMLMVVLVTAALTCVFAFIPVAVFSHNSYPQSTQVDTHFSVTPAGGKYVETVTSYPLFTVTSTAVQPVRVVWRVHGAPLDDITRSTLLMCTDGPECDDMMAWILRDGVDGTAPTNGAKFPLSIPFMQVENEPGIQLPVGRALLYMLSGVELFTITCMVIMWASW